MTKSLLLLGESDVGKSHFGGQLLGRLNTEKYHLRMVGAPTQLRAFETVLDRLHNGRASPHTSQAVYEESNWPIADAQGNRIDLVWPDYGGEQVRTLRNDRSMPPDWRSRILSSNGWAVMVRITHAHLSDDIFSRPLGELSQPQKTSGPFTMSDQARLVDFLQWLLFIRGCSSLRPVTNPSLLMLLSCWDELPSNQQSDKPRDVLRSRMPLVSAFIEANWTAEARHVLGLSALERPLREDVVDEEYVERGPEAFGYVVAEDGTRDPDLTLAIAPLL